MERKSLWSEGSDLWLARRGEDLSTVEPGFEEEDDDE
jgi:hypothetical protein